MMSEVLLHHGDWVVVCDGAKALVFENTGPLNSPKLKTRETYQHKSPPTHELGTDAPGRSFSSAGHGRSAVSQTDWHDQAEKSFLESLAHRLDAAVTAGLTKSIVLVASPRALGMIRAAYSKALREAVKSEIHKDLVKLPVHEIEKHLT
jgi:protein required for attachment to host cells